MRFIGLIATLIVFASSALACTNMNRLPVFQEERHSTGKPDFGQTKKSRRIVVKHALGISAFSISAKQGAVGQYTRNGTGAPLPVSVLITKNKCRKNFTNRFTKKLHARLPMEKTYAMRQPLTNPANQEAVVALAKTVLATTYCRGGTIKVNPNFRYVDDSGSQPVVKTAPAIASYPNAIQYAWGVHFTCSLWRLP